MIDNAKVITIMKIRCGEGLEALYNSAIVQHFLNSVPQKKVLERTIHKKGTLRKVCMYCFR